MLDFTKSYETNTILPDGWYEARVELAEYKTSKNTGVDYLNIMFKTDKNQTVFNMYNIFNKSDIARNIAMGAVKLILEFQGYDVSKLGDISKEKLLELLNNGGPLQIELGNKTDDFGTKNTIKKYKASANRTISAPIKDSSIPF